MELGEKIKTLREGLNLTQKELSERTGLTLRTVQRIENEKVKPSFHSLKMIGEVLNADLSDNNQEAQTKPYEFQFTIKISDMNQFISDLKTLIKNNWKFILIIMLIILFLSNYRDIKSGFLDGWNK